MYRQALEDRHAIDHQAVAAALATSTTFDREVSATAYLLQGLSQSPALKGGDNRAFYDQLVDTPRPQGSWFVLWSMDRQVGTWVTPVAEMRHQTAQVTRLGPAIPLGRRGAPMADTVGPAKA